MGTVEKLSEVCSRHFARAILLLSMIVVLVAVLVSRPERNGIHMDQMTFLLQAMSLAHDLDLRYEMRDRERFQELGWGSEPLGLYLRQASGSYFFAKPFGYAMLCAPWMPLLRNRGPLLANAVCWCLLLELSFRWLRRFIRAPGAALLAVLCWGGSAALFYVFVIHHDVMIMFLTATVMYLGFVPVADGVSPGRNRSVLLGLCSGLLLYQRFPAGFFVVSVVVLWAVRGHALRAFISAGIGLVGLVVLSCVHVCEDGCVSPYQGNRISVIEADPFSPEKNLRAAPASTVTQRFFQGDTLRSVFHMNSLFASFRYAPRTVLHLLAGRKQGIVPYMIPIAAVVCLGIVSAGSRRTRLWLWAVGPFLIYAACMVLAQPLNYHGGQTTLGNRYLLQVSPALLFAVAGGVGTPVVVGSILLCTLSLLWFPGPLYLQSGTALRDNFLVMQWNRFQALPLEPELLLHGCDRQDCHKELSRSLHVYRLSEPSLASVAERAWVGAGGLSRIALIGTSGDCPVPAVRLSTSSYEVTATLCANGTTRSFHLPPDSTCVLDVPGTSRLFRPSVQHELALWEVEVRALVAVESRAELRIAPGATLHTVFFERGQADTSATCHEMWRPEEFLWGWWDGAARKGSRRWAGCGLKSALVVPAMKPETRFCEMRTSASSFLVPQQVTMLLRGVSQAFDIGTTDTRLKLSIDGTGGSAERILHLWHQSAATPAEASGDPFADPRALSVEYGGIQFVRSDDSNEPSCAKER